MMRDTALLAVTGSRGLGCRSRAHASRVAGTSIGGYLAGREIANLSWAIWNERSAPIKRTEVEPQHIAFAKLREL